MVAQSSDSEVPQFDMEEEGKKLDILLPAQAGSVRVEYASLRAEEGEEPETISEISFVPPAMGGRTEQIRTHPVRARLDLFEHVAGVAPAGVPGYSAKDPLPAYLGTLLYKLQDHATEAYLKTASLANPSYAFHDEEHSARVSNHLEQLASLHEPTASLNPAEYFLVMAGAWTHDIGFAQSSHREIHHKQAREIICNDRTIRAYLGNDETAIEVVARLAYNHSSKVDVASIEDWPPTIELIPGQSHRVRVRHLSCLLRLADALDIDKRRAIRNRVLLEKLKSSNPVSYAYHVCHQRIQYVGINSGSRQIDIRAMVQTKIDQDRIRRFINERLKLRREVRTLVPYLRQCILGFQYEINLDIQLTPQAPRLPAKIVTKEFLSGK